MFSMSRSGLCVQEACENVRVGDRVGEWERGSEGARERETGGEWEKERERGRVGERESC